jgi:hypothetical protein
MDAVTKPAPSDDSVKPKAQRSRPIELPETPEVTAALLELQAARGDAEASLDAITDASKRALDLPAKVRRNPVRTAALVGGAGFLIAGGPRRMVRYAVGRVRPEVRDPHAGLLPDEIEKVLKDSGLADDPAIRRALDEDFADYLRRKGRLDREPTPTSILWRTFDQLAGPLGTAGARVLVQRLMSAEKERGEERAARRAAARARTTAPGQGGDPV